MFGRWRCDRLANLCRFQKLDSCVLMVKAAKDRKCNNVSEPLDRACAGRVLPKRNVSSHLIIIDGVFGKNSSKVLCVEHDQMISALTPDRPDQAFNIAVLPGRAERSGSIPNAHCSGASFECPPECSVIVANEIFRCRIPRERLGDLPCQPLGRWISGHCNPEQLAPAMAENKKCE